MVEDTDLSDPLARFQGEEVVLDTQGPLIFIGRLMEVGAGHVVLVDADVHDTNDSRASKDLYVLETRDLGIRVNRAMVMVMRGEVASVSFLRDVVD
jgi:hypothetical protein